MVLVSALVAVLPAAAAGPIDGEVGAVYWSSNFDVNGATADATAPGLRAELWFVERYGLRAATYRSELDGADLESSDSANVDFIWRVVSVSRNNYFALGAGWQQMDIAAIGLQDTSGARLDADARIAVTKWFYFYGQGAYLPSLEDAASLHPAGGRFENMEAYEFEVGFAFEPTRFLSVRGGYRDCSLDYTRLGFDTQGTELPGTVQSSGFLLGLGIYF
jgi:hypothetical protein